MRQRRVRKESRNIGFSAMLSLLALNVVTRISLSGLFHHAGISPHRIGTSARSSPPLTTTSIVSVGQMLYRGWKFVIAGTERWWSETNSCHVYILVKRSHIRFRPNLALAETETREPWRARVRCQAQ